MRVLITGGAGFIGYHLTKHLADNGYEITICDNLFRGKMDDDFETLISRNNVTFVQADLTQSTSFDHLGTDFTLIYHLAAINGTKHFYEIPEKVLRTNILSLMNILDWMVSAASKNMVWLSSSEVYAGTMIASELAIPTPETVPLTIADVFNPRNSYAASKITGELLCLSYARAHDMSIRIVRPHNIYGPRMGYEHVIPQFIMRILEQEDPFKIIGATQSRSFCYIDDFVSALRLLGEFDQTLDQCIVNIGTDEETTILDLAKRMFRLFGVDPSIDILPPPEGSVDRRCPDITQARTLLGYEPKVDLDTGLRLTYDWYFRQNVANRITNQSRKI